jgi:methyl-galactoside transport system substrate-binding protein
MAEGAIAALATAGYNTGDKGSRQIPIFGVDATAAAMDLIAKGKMTGTVKQDAEGMAAAVALLADNALAEGQKLNSGLEKYNVDPSVFKIRIPYAEYFG